MAETKHVTGAFDGTLFRFECPYCSRAYAWSAEQVMSTTGEAIADECRHCGEGFTVLKPRGGVAGATATASALPSVEQRHGARQRVLPDGSMRSAYEYKVVPFIGRSTGSVSAATVAEQLEAEIARHATAGWEFYQLSDVNIEVQPGCLAGLLGATTQYVRFDQLIFRSVRS